MRGLRGEAAIVGIAEFAPERKPSREWMGLEVYSELARQALADAGLSIRDVDGIITGNNVQRSADVHPGHADRAHGHRVPLLRGAGPGRRGGRGRGVARGGGHRSGTLQASGRGTLYSYTVARREQSPEFAADTPYIIATITLEEGPRMTSLLVEADPDQRRHRRSSGGHLGRRLGRALNALLPAGARVVESVRVLLGTRSHESANVHEV